MIITRHNYEEYFILYMDNELGNDERRQVELFVQENADLKEELDWLLQSRLVPDDSLVFDNKERLMKTSGAEFINTTNYEAWLLLYTDNELTVEQKLNVEKFAAGHPAIQEELELLQKTKFEPEPGIVFPNKESLYRKEEKFRVIAINWRKIVVAATVLLAVSTMALIEFNKKGDSIGEPDLNESMAIQPTQKSAVAVPNGVTSNTNVIAEESSADKIDKEENIVDKAITPNNKRTIALKEKNIQPSSLPIKADSPIVAENKNGLPDPTHNPNVNRSMRQDNPIARADILNDRSLTNSTENIEPSNVTPGNSQSLNNVVTVASVESIDPTDAEPGRKNKLRGFFRKVTRTFEKATNIKATDDEDRLLLGGLAIKL